MERSFICGLLAMAYVFVFFAASLAFAQPDSSAPKAVAFDFRGVGYAHRWSNGKAITVRFVISDITPTSCRFEQSFSDDDGKTWEVNWSRQTRKYEQVSSAG